MYIKVNYEDMIQQSQGLVDSSGAQESRNGYAILSRCMMVNHCRYLSSLRSTKSI
jgi:hypothetical protein